MAKGGKGKKIDSGALIIKLTGLLLILAGSVLILWVFSAKRMVSRQQDSLRRAYAAQSAPMEAGPEVLENAAGDVLPGNLPEGEGQPAPGHSSPLQPICLLRIPKIGLDAVVAEGIGDSVLRYAVGHFEETPMPGEAGNSCLSGHRSYAFGQFFNRLDELEIGDRLLVERNEQVYTYTVTEIFVVEPEETWVLDQTADAQITLITCTPIRIATHRLIVKGILET